MEQSVLEYLDRAAECWPERCAFCENEHQLTFSQLRQLAQRIGSSICRCVSAGNPVLVMTGRHVYTPACYLGVVCAGCFYAPMDAEMPLPRLDQIVQVMQAPLLLVDRAHLPVAQSLDFDGQIMVMEDALEAPVEQELLRNAVRRLTDQSPLYVIFTSGSTGIPKGVVTSHHALMCYIDDVQKVLALTDEDILGNQAPLDYIAAIRDIYLPLRTGAMTVILPKTEFSVPISLFETMNRYRVTTLCWSVSGLQLPVKMNAFQCARPQFVNKVLFSGSVMPCRDLRVWQDALPDARFINQYGPTETTASCTCYPVQKRVSDTDVLPIGVPYDHYSVFLLNEDGTPAPDGEIGEICVSGPCLALGYYNQAEQTEKVFVQNPLNHSYREIIYKTGDLGAYRADGLLEFHGRKDRQIKHLGHRIELGEIEQTARQMDGIIDCCALYHSEKERLTLFYTGDRSKREIVLHFRNVLPAFMVPRSLVHLETLPLLPNGKIDMRALEKQL